MKKIIIISAMAALMMGCMAPTEMQVRVAPLGEVVPESTEQYLYALPQTVLKVEVSYQETRHLPGPFMEYAEKYLGIREVIRQIYSRWEILDVQITPHAELDPDMLFHVNVIEGDFITELMEPLMDKGIIIDGSDIFQEEVKSPSLGTSVIRDYIRYNDLGIESNFEERTETMYKTIVTDTSFVQVPVDRTITEQKSPARKAKEAADFVLELRTRRFELLTGGYDAIPQGVAMQAALDKLDELEASYLSLFTGKTFGKTEVMSWFIVPESGSSRSDYRLGMFSKELGFVPEEIMEGAPLQIVVEPMGNTSDIRTYYDVARDEDKNNVLYYRLPDMAELKVLHGNTELSKQRISVYQSGALISSPLK